MTRTKMTKTFMSLMTLALMTTSLLTPQRIQARQNNESFTRCLSSEAGPIAKVDFKPLANPGWIDANITVVLGYTDDWLKVSSRGLHMGTPEDSSWQIYKLTAPPIRSEEIMRFGISDQAVETGYNGFIYPAFLDVIFPSGEPKRFLLECYHDVPMMYWHNSDGTDGA